ncbi:MAG: hypothetical protein ACNA7Y_03960 [Gammaproteobacteria bacterium]
MAIDSNITRYQEVADRMLERLDFVRLQPQTIICDAGYVTDLLHARYPQAKIFHENQPADLIVSNLKIDETQNLTAAIQAWYDNLQPEGLLMFSVFGVWDMHEVGDALLKARFSNPVMDRDEFPDCEVIYGHAWHPSDEIRIPLSRVGRIHR